MNANQTMAEIRNQLGQAKQTEMKLNDEWSLMKFDAPDWWNQ